MRNLAVSALVLAATLGTAAAQTPPGAAPEPMRAMPPMMFGTPDMIRSQGALFGRVLPSVVSISVRKAANRPGSAMVAGGTSPEGRAFGSGFIIDPQGLIATNYHVVQDGSEITVGFFDGTRAPARLVNATRLVDVAIIKVDMDHPLPAVKWGDSDRLEVGDPVFAVGNALDVGTSVSGGLVSALNRDLMDSPYDDYIQTDAAINHGNSGGPLFNAQGEVVGIDTALVSPTSGSAGVGFAIPSSNAQIIVDRLLNYGWLRPGWIGLKVQQVTAEMAAALGMKRAEGSIVAMTMQDSPAAQAGLRAGDVVIAVDGKPPTDERALLRTIATTPIGQTLALHLWRDGKPQDLEVVVKEWPREQWERIDAPVSMTVVHREIPPDLGLALGPLDAASRKNAGVADGQSGLLITGVVPNSDADQRGLAAGDVLLRIQDTDIASATQVNAALAVARQRQQKFVLVLIQAKRHRLPGPEWKTLQLVSD